MSLTAANQMVVSLARLLRNGETVFHGVASPVPVTAILLAKAMHAPDLVYLSICGGIDAKPQSLPKSTAHPELAKGTRSLFSLTEIFDLSARGGLDTAFLSGVQIDVLGNINMSCIGDFHKPKVRLPGGAGSAVVMPTAGRTLLWRTKHDPKIFVEKVPFTTAVGKVDKVVTPKCIFQRSEGRLKVWRLMPGTDWDELAGLTGFPLEPCEDMAQEPGPTEEELTLLERIDPQQVRLTEF